jgi:hypothetical protein
MCSLCVLMQLEGPMYVVFAEELESGPPNPRNSARTLEEAFVRICCRCGLSYEFFPEDDGWRLQLRDVERPGRSPAPIRSKYKRPQDAQRDLMAQAVDGRIRGHVAVPSDVFAKMLIMKSERGVRAHVA